MGSHALRVAILAAIGLSTQAHAYDCRGLANWNAASVYTSGDQIQDNNQAYKARYWTQGNDPANNSGPWEAWETLGRCDTGGGNLPPEVSLLSPLNNAVIPEGTQTTLQANASDKDGSVTRVEFFANNQSLAVVTQEPYSTEWTAALGTSSIVAVATDDEGASSQTSVQISVTPAGGLVPPSITLTSPTGSESITSGDTLVLSADASDSDGEVAKVEFFVDNQLVATDSQAPYEHNWLAQAGTHSFKATATDNDAQSTVSQEVSLTVSSSTSGGCAGTPSYVSGTEYTLGQEIQNLNNKYRCDVAGWCSSNSDWAYAPGEGLYWTDAWTDLGACSTPPTVSITSPQDNQVVLAGSLVNIAADAIDSDGTVSQVEIIVNQQSIALLTQAPYSYDWNADAVGNNTITVVATDNDNNQGQDSISISVSDQDLVISLTSPTSGQIVRLGKGVKIAANATSLTSDVNKVEFLVNGSVVASDSTAPYEHNWLPGAVGNYTVSALAFDTTGTSVSSSAATISVIEQTEKTHKLIGYWHNFVNGAGCPIRLADMSSAWDIIDIAFAENDRNSDGTVHFNLYSGDIYSDCPALDPVQFKQDMATLQAQGKKFVLSLGGAEGTITLNTDTDEAAFVSSLTAIVAEWGFDGLDVDLESGSNLLHGSQIQARLGRALLQIEQNMGGDMYLTMAPEHPYVQGGYIAYSGIWGAYIPVIDEVRDTLDLLHVQLYNNGGLPNPYMAGSAPEGSVDMMVAQSKMLIEGFELANGTMFKPLRDDQVAIGLPSGPSSANSGQAPTQNILDALDCLTKGEKCQTIRPAFNYPNYAGVMTWSINWDEHDGFKFSVPVGNKLTEMNNSQ